MEFKTAGIVLKKQNFGEADRILRIFTQELGVVSALAKGVKKTNSRKAGSLELFSEANFRLHRKSGELFLITDAAPISSFESKDLAVLRTAYATSELILNIAPPEKSLPKIYKIFQEFLFIILNSVSNPKLQLLKVAFFVKVLSIFGFFAIEAKTDIREKKFFRFLLEKDFTEILQLENDAKLFQAAETKLSQILENESERISKVSAATQNWQ